MNILQLMKIVNKMCVIKDDIAKLQLKFLCPSPSRHPSKSYKRNATRKIKNTLEYTHSASRYSTEPTL